MATKSTKDYIVPEHVNIDEWRKHIYSKVESLLNKGINYDAQIYGLRNLANIFTKIGKKEKVSVENTQEFDRIVTSLSRFKPQFSLEDKLDKDQPKNKKHALTIAKVCTKSNLKLLKSILDDEDTNFDDADVVAMTLNDEADHLEISSLVYEGNVLGAYKIMHDLDTASRDVIPDASYNWIDQTVENAKETPNLKQTKKKTAKPKA